MARRLLLGCVLVMALVSILRGEGGGALAEIPWRETPELEVEHLGRPAGAPAFAELPLVALANGRDYVKPLWYRGEGRKLHVVSLRLRTGAVKQHPAVDGHEVWQTLRLGGKLYLGLNLPASLVEYDPASDAFRVLGTFSEGTLFRLIRTPDDKIAIGLANGPTKVLLYDPASGQTRDYGALSDQHGYVYELTADREYLYAALRGSVPWQLVAVNRSSGQKHVLLTAPAEGYINPGHDGQGATARVSQHARDPQSPYADYRLRGAEAVPLEEPLPPAPRAPVPAEPEVLIDDSQAYETGKLAVYYRFPEDKPANEPEQAAPERLGWRMREVEAALEPKTTARLVRWDDQTLAGATHSYGPLFVYDIEKDVTRFPAMSPGMNVYALAAHRGSLYLTGYPTSTLARFDLRQPATSPRGAPGRPGIDWTETAANPRILRRLAEVEGLNAHTGVAIFPGADGRLYTLAMRHRYFRGCDLVWHDPANDQFGVVDDGGWLRHQQASWIAPLEGGRKLLISTHLKPDPDLPGEKPQAGQLLLFDTASGKYVSRFTPFPEEPALGAVVEVRPGVVMGLVTESAWDGGRPTGKPNRTTIYRFDLEQGKVLRTRSYGDVLVGVPDLHGIPRQGYSFEKGPDGHVWTVYSLPWADSPEQFVRIDPEELAVQPVGKIPPSGWVRFVFVGDDIYFTGAPQLRRVRNVVPR